MSRVRIVASSGQSSKLASKLVQAKIYGCSLKCTSNLPFSLKSMCRFLADAYYTIACDLNDDKLGYSRSVLGAWLKQAVDSSTSDGASPQYKKHVPIFEIS